MRKPKVSIIVIAYNDQVHIDTAVQSARNQTMSDIEIICVDDGSTDDTLKHMNNHSSVDSRVKTITQKNGGMFSARYNGLQMANGEYVLFVDSDDKLLPNAVEILCETAEKEKADVIEFGIATFSEGVNPPSIETISFFEKYFSPDRQYPKKSSGPSLISDSFKEKIISWNVWSKIYKRELLLFALQGYDGEYINMAEDMLFSIMVLSCAKKYCRINSILYMYNIGGGMSTNQAKLSSESEIRNCALEYMILYLAHKWMKILKIDEKKREEGITAFHNRVCEGVFSRFLTKCIPEKRNIFLNWIEICNNKDEFCDDLIESVFDKGIGKGEDAVYALRGSWIAKTKKTEIHTIAMYYYRLYNGGIERVMVCLAEILQKAGYKVVVVTEQDANELDYELPDGTGRAILGCQHESKSERAKAWKTILDNEKIDLVLYHSWVDPNIMVDSIAIKASGIPFVVHTHLAADEPFRWQDHRWVKQEKAYALADMIITLSEVDDAWWRALGFRTAHVSNPCTFDYTKVNRASLETKNVLWVGRLNSVKQYEEAFAIAQIVHREIPDFRMHILGKAETEKKTNEIIMKLKETGLDEFIVYDGFRNDVSKNYEEAAVFLSTSRVEGFPMTFLESKAYGIPMVAYELSNVDFLRYPKGVYVVAQCDRYEAAQRIISLLNSQSLRNQMGEEAYQSLVDCYKTPLELVWKEILSSCLNERGGVVPLCQRAPIETAISRVIESLENRPAENTISTQEMEMIKDYGRVNHTLYEVVNSTSWKVGRMITYIPRKIKTLILHTVYSSSEK